MILSIETLFNEPRIVNAIIDRTMQTKQDTVHWRRYLTAHESMSTTFATYLGTTSQVVVGTMIDPHSNKPLRKRRGIQKGVGSIGTFGDRFQMDNARMDLLLELIRKFNGTQSHGDLNAIIDFLTDDYREVLLAPMMAIDKMIGDARSRGVYNVNLGNGTSSQITLPIEKIVATGTDLGSFVSWYRDLLESQADKGKTFAAAQMTARTFQNKIVKSKEFTDTYKLKFGSFDVSPASIVTLDMANTLLGASGIETPIELVSERVTLPDGTTYKSFADDAVCLLPQNNLGTLEYYKSIEWTDRVPGKVYTEAEGGAVLVSSERTGEGRFLEYQMNAAPNLSIPNKMTILDVSATPVTP